MQKIALQTQGLLNAKQTATAESIAGHIYVPQRRTIFQGARKHLGASVADSVARQSQKSDDGMRLESNGQVLAAYVSNVALPKVDVSETSLQAQHLG